MTAKRLTIVLTTTAILMTTGCDQTSSVNSHQEPNDAIEWVNHDEGYVDRIDSRLDQIIAVDAKLQILGEGYSWSEGPLWLPDQKRLIFSDVPNNVIYSWADGDGAQPWLEPSGCTSDACGSQGSNGLLLDADGKLILAQHGDRRMARLMGSLDEPTASFQTLSDRYEGKRFNSPNDAVFDRYGNLYFTDPPYGLADGEDDPARELDFQGVYRLAPSGEVKLLTDELTRPNGIAISHDGNELIVANSDPSRAIWMRYSITDDGIGAGQVMFDATDWVESRPGLPDGLKVDHAGNIYATGPGGVLVFSADYQHLGTIRTPGPTANCALDSSEDYLYLTTNRYLLRVALHANG